MGVLQWWNAIPLPPSSCQTLEETAGRPGSLSLMRVPLRGSVLQLEGHELGQTSPAQTLALRCATHCLTLGK